jgi:hypothetical protein
VFGRAPVRDNEIQYGFVAMVFIAFALLSFVTAFYLDQPDQTLFEKSVVYSPPAEPDVEPIETGERLPSRDFALVGPFAVERPGTVLQISLSANPPKNSWVFIEGEILDAGENYLMSFGNELWYETGTDSDGYWAEAYSSYQIKLTMPEAGQFYLNLKTQSEKKPQAIGVSIRRVRGSTIPHLIFGCLLLAIGLVLNEFANKTIQRTMGAMQ